jgi:hypothetical protein
MSWAGTVELDSEAAGAKGQESEEFGEHVDCSIIPRVRCSLLEGVS